MQDGASILHLQRAIPRVHDDQRLAVMSEGMPTTEPWAGDALDRKQFGQHIIATLRKRFEVRRKTGVGSFILNLDAAWGEGKTYFLTNLAADLRQQGHAVATVNAWEDDRGDDPLTTVVAAIEEALSPFIPAKSNAGKILEAAKASLGPMAVEASKQLGKHLFRLGTGISIDRMLDVAKATNSERDDDAANEAGEAMFDKAVEAVVGERVKSHRDAKRAVGDFRKKLEAVLVELDGKVALPMFVMIDELDRCRPSYAIEMLEDMKHIFEIEGVVFVVATDGEQLGHAVQGVYGASFDSQRYLRRFFDRVATFPPTQKAQLVIDFANDLGIDFERFHRTNNMVVTTIFASWASAMPLSARDFRQVLEIVATFEASWPYDLKIEPITTLMLATSYFQDPRSFSERKASKSLREMLKIDWNLPSPRRESGLNAINYVNEVISSSSQTLRDINQSNLAYSFYDEDIRGQQEKKLLAQFGNRLSSSVYADFISLAGRNLTKDQA